MTKRFWGILGIIFVLGCSLSLAQDSAEDVFNELLANYVDDTDNGVVLYASYQGQEVVVARGLANLETGETVQVDDLFRLASVTKPFVATVVLQLVGEGLIGLDDPIADYLPADLGESIANAQDATIRQMLQMTSGIYNYTDTDAYYDAVYANPTYPWTAEETLTFIFDEDAYFEAGEGYYYSNSNYNLAQIVIENVTDSTLQAELDTRIFKPLGMDSCYLETPDRFAKDIVRGYELDDDGLLDVTEVNDGVGLGDGGIICSAADLGKFLPALLSGELLSDALLGAMLDTVDDGEGGLYGLGIGYYEGDFGTEIGHDGASSGFQSVMMAIPDELFVLVILTNNFDSEIMADLTYDATALVLGE